MIKRNYYQLNIDKEFENAFEFEDEHKRKEYFTYCQFFGNLGALAEFKEKNTQTIANKIKMWMYLLYLLALPL